MDKPYSQATYDLAVIGGGIAGAGIARDASLRGLKTLLLEKGTFGCGTSSKSSKLIHGGIRYLETAWSDLKKGHAGEAWKNFCFVFTSLRESRILRRIAPEVVQPLPLLIPVLKDSGRALWEVCLGSWLYFFLSLLSGPAKCPRVLWDKTAVLEILPALDPKNVKGGVIIWDHWTDDQALVRETILSAARHGAEVLEHAEVLSYQPDPETGAYKIYANKNGTEHAYFAKKLVNASGPWVDKLRERGKERVGDLIVPVAGSHIELKKFISHSVILEAEDGRLFFVVNHGEISRVGTTERVCEDPDSVAVTQAEIEYLLKNLRKYFPSLDLGVAQVISQDAGIRPLARPKNERSAHTISREHEIRTGPTGVIHVLGVKLTDHRRAAEKVVDLFSEKKSTTRSTPLML